MEFPLIKPKLKLQALVAKRLTSEQLSELRKDFLLQFFFTYVFVINKILSQLKTFMTFLLYLTAFKIGDIQCGNQQAEQVS